MLFSSIKIHVLYHYSKYCNTNYAVSPRCSKHWKTSNCNFRSDFGIAESKTTPICIRLCCSHDDHQVEYSAGGLLEKNRDHLASEVMNMLRMSQIALVRTLFCGSITKTGTCRNFSGMYHYTGVLFLCLRRYALLR